MMRNILRHATAESREQRPSCAKIVDPKNQDKTKRRKAGVMQTKWDNTWTKWSGNQRWWEGSGDWKSFTKTATDLRRRALIKEVDEKKGRFSKKGMENDQTRLRKKEGRRP